MFQTENIKFGEWSPDLVSLYPNSSPEIVNCIPVLDGYAPFPSPVAEDGAVADPIIGGAQYSISGVSYSFVGTATNVYRVSGSSATSIGSGYTAVEPFGWDFALAENDIVACNQTDGFVSGDADTGTLSAIAAAPNAAHCMYYEGFLFAGNIVSDESKISWSAFNDITDWTPDSATQSGEQQLPAELGEVMGFNDYPFMTIFQRQGITRGTFTGGDTIFRFDTLERNKGLLASRSQVTADRRTFFLSDDGFNAWDGQRATSISEGKVTDWFFNECDESIRPLVRGAIDRRRRIVLWFWPGSRVFLIYSYRHNKFVRGLLSDSINVDDIYPVASPSSGYDLDTDAPGESSTLDTADGLPESFDDPFWRGGAFSVQLFHEGVRSRLEGLPLAAVLETNDTQVSPGRRVTINQIWPIVDADGSQLVKACLGTRAQKLADPIVYGSEATMNDTGFCAVRGNGRYVRSKVSVPADVEWTHTPGVQVPYKDAGAR